MKVTTPSPEGIAMIHAEESCELSAYLDVAGVWTIGYGTTRYFGGQRVKAGDTCTQDQADSYFAYDLQRFALAVDALTVDSLLQRQFDALTSFNYNVGENAYRNSTLRKTVNANPNDPAIRQQFMRWHFADGKPVKGLWNRRHREADFYFGEQTPRPPFLGGTAK